MECAVDAQSLISMSLRKIHSSRTQRGGVKLHKNLLVSYVLRNARQVYMNERYAEIYRMQQEQEQRYGDAEEVEEVLGIRQLEPLQERPASLHPEQHEEDGDGDGEEVVIGKEPAHYRSCCSCAEPYPVPHCNKTTVLDLDTHVVTTVDSGYLHQDCCSPSAPVRKRKVGEESGVRGGLGSPCCCACYQPEEPSCKRARLTEPCPAPAPVPQHQHPQQQRDTSGISNLISIFGSGFTGLVSRQTELEQALNGHLCSQQALGSLGAWTRTIVAF